MFYFLSGLDATKATSSVHAYQFLSVQPIAITALRIGEALGNNIIHCLVFGLIMTGTEHDLLTKFLKMKPLNFVCSYMDYAFNLIEDWYEKLYKWVLLRCTV